MEDSEAQYCNDEPLKQFIEAYEHFEFLWDPSHSEYQNKMLRYEAYEALRLILDQLKPNCTTEDVRKKINTLRSNYRKEYVKINSSPDGSYKTTSRAFQYLSFLERLQPELKPNCTTEEVRKKINTLRSNWKDSDEHAGPNVSYKSTSNEPQYQSILERRLSEPIRSEVVMEDSMNVPSDTSLRSQSPTHSSSAKRRAKPENNGFSEMSFHEQPQESDDDVMRSAYQEKPKRARMTPTAAARLLKPKTQDNCPMIARAWGETLLTLDPQQRIFAEKLVADVLFEARLGNLNKDKCMNFLEIFKDSR